MTDHLYACTLSTGELAQAATLYARAAATYHATVTYGEDGALVTLRGDVEQIAAVLDDMIAREGGCCTHLSIEPRATADGYRVLLHVHGERDIAGAVLRQTIPVLFPTAEEIRI